MIAVREPYTYVRCLLPPPPFLPLLPLLPHSSVYIDQNDYIQAKATGGASAVAPTAITVVALLALIMRN